MSNIVKHQEQAEAIDWATLKEQAKIALASRYLPKAITTPEQAITIALAGRELGLPPLTAFRSIFLVEGKPVLAADLMHALVYKRVPGGSLDILRTDSNVCEVEACRPGGKPCKISFTIEDAKAAGLTGKDNWRKYPAAMLRARAIAAACRAVFPDVFIGVYTPEELEATPSAPPVQFDATPANGDALDALLAAIESAQSEAELALASDAAKKVWRTLPEAARLRVKEAAAAAKGRFVEAAPASDDPERAAIQEVQ